MAPKAIQKSGTTAFTHIFTREQQGNITDFYDGLSSRREALGEGSYGKVVKGKNKETGAVRAIKSIDVSKLSDPRRFEEEIEIQKSLDHPNIVKLYETFKDAKKIYLVMELCTGGELFDRIVEEAEKHEGVAFDENTASSYMAQILGAMQYLHNKNFCHRDIKPENFLMQDTTKTAKIKVIDFGLAKSFRVGSGDKMKTKAGTPYYVAPQVLAGSYDEKCDIWSCGVICYILLCGYPPFHGDTDEDILRRVKRGTKDYPSPDWDGVSKDGKQFIDAMLTFDPKSRPTAADLLAHKWLTAGHQKSSVSVPKDLTSRMKKFIQINKFKKVALTMIAQQLKDSDLKQLTEAFERCDANKDGQVSLEELKKVLDECKIPSEDLESIMKGVDTDGSTHIDYTEFIASTLEAKTYTKREVLWSAFRTFDIDGDGKITAQELHKILPGEDKSKIEQMIKEADKDGNGTVDFEEFVSLMQDGDLGKMAKA